MYNFCFIISYAYLVNLLHICLQTEQPGRGPRKRTSKVTLNNTKKKRKNSSSEESEGEGEEDEEAEDEEGELDEEEGSDDEKNGSDGNKSDSSQSKDVPKHFHVSNQSMF